MAEMLKRGDTVRALYAGVPGPTVWRITSFVMLPWGKAERLHVVLADPRGGGTYTLPHDQIERVHVALWERAA